MLDKNISFLKELKKYNNIPQDKSNEIDLSGRVRNINDIRLYSTNIISNNELEKNIKVNRNLKYMNKLDRDYKVTSISSTNFKHIICVGDDGRLFINTLDNELPIKIANNKTLDECIVEETPDYIIYSDGEVTADNPIPEGIYFACRVDKHTKEIYTGPGYENINILDINSKYGLSLMTERSRLTRLNTFEYRLNYTEPQGYINGPNIGVDYDVVDSDRILRLKPEYLNRKIKFKAVITNKPLGRKVAGWHAHAINNTGSLLYNVSNDTENNVFEFDLTVSRIKADPTETFGRLSQLRNHKDGNTDPWSCYLEFYVSIDDQPFIRSKCPTGKIIIKEKFLTNNIVVANNELVRKPVTRNLGFHVDARHGGSNSTSTNILKDLVDSTNGLVLDKFLFDDTDGWRDNYIKINGVNTNSMYMSKSIRTKGKCYTLDFKFSILPSYRLDAFIWLLTDSHENQNSPPILVYDARLAPNAKNDCFNWTSKVTENQITDIENIHIFLVVENEKSDVYIFRGSELLVHEKNYVKHLTDTAVFRSLFGRQNYVENSYIHMDFVSYRIYPNIALDKNQVIANNKYESGIQRSTYPTSTSNIIMSSSLETKGDLYISDSVFSFKRIIIASESVLESELNEFLTINVSTESSFSFRRTNSTSLFGLEDFVVNNDTSELIDGSFIEITDESRIIKYQQNIHRDVDETTYSSMIYDLPETIGYIDKILSNKRRPFSNDPMAVISNFSDSLKYIDIFTPPNFSIYTKYAITYGNCGIYSLDMSKLRNLIYKNVYTRYMFLP